MATITIDDKEYDYEQMSEEAKAQLVNIQFVDAELARVNGLQASLSTARFAYVAELKRHLDPFSAEAIKFN